jgi:hypothetical protein
MCISQREYSASSNVSKLAGIVKTQTKVSSKTNCFITRRKAMKRVNTKQQRRLLVTSQFALIVIDQQDE